MNQLEHDSYRQLMQGIGAANAQAREAAKRVVQAEGRSALLESQVQKQKQDIENLAAAMKGLKENRSGNSHIQYIEDIPGRQVPFDLVVRIPINSNSTSIAEATFQISQDGPFIAVRRYGIFQSAHQFSYTDPETSSVSSFRGRSFGRFRPIHSAWDLNDAQAFQPTAGALLPGTGVGIFASPSNHSGFRTMQFDGNIRFENSGSSYPRQNTDIPSAFYTSEINSPFDLGALDFFERGESLKWSVTPLHTNNPNYGNVFGFTAGGSYPFDDSQYDVHEGILDPVKQGISTDPVIRLPDGFLILGFHGYRIIQPPGSVSRT